jgi:alkylation response protein AidB-like acyl-CoA dehydrogenase
MSLPLSPEDLAFQAEVRQFVEANLPADIAARVQEHKGDYKGDYTRWMKILAQKGWSAPHWPTQYGGAGLTPWQRHLFEEVVQSYPVPFAAPFGTTMVGPVIYTFGTAAQKAKFLPGTANFDIWWCQGYSEPGSGSDLAKLSTKAVRDGDDYIVSGTKIWTSYAQHADWIFCLVRTAFDDRKPQQGISFLLFDMKTPGIEIQPIISIDGQHHLNMVHFTDVRVPVENRIGEENMGWTYAKFLLQYERFGIAEVAESQARITKLRRMAREQDLEGDTSYMQALAQTEIELKALAGTNLRYLAADAQGKPVGAEASALKIRGSEIRQRLTELAIAAGGSYLGPLAGYGRDVGSNWDEVLPDHLRGAADDYFFSRAATIYGGTNEIQRNVIAKATLGL